MFDLQELQSQRMEGRDGQAFGGIAFDAFRHALAHLHGNDRAGLERLLRYCARLCWASERLARAGDGEQRIYTLPKPALDRSCQITLTPPQARSWVRLIARIYEVDPLRCRHCGGAMQLIAFIIESAGIVRILDHVGEPSLAPRRAPIRGPPCAPADERWGVIDVSDGTGPCFTLRRKGALDFLSFSQPRLRSAGVLRFW